jgi:polysaccharide biosynthesis protein PslG
MIRAVTAATKARPRRVGSLLAAGAVALCLAACGGGDSDNNGGAPAPRAAREFYGVISAEPFLDGATLERLGRGGVGTLRVNFGWGLVQASRGAPYDWSRYDLLVGGAAVNGIRVLATVYGSAIWAEPSPEYPPLGSALPGFAAFVRAAVARYGADGTFWRQHPELPARPIEDWQLWNEPNSLYFWKPAPDPKSYLTVLRAFHTEVKRADPDASVMLGGLFPTPKGIDMPAYMSDLYRLGAAKLFDEAAVHPYAADPERALAATEELRGLMDRAGDGSKPIWITEVGWASGGQPSGLTVGPERQAEYLTRIFELAAGARQRLRLGGVVWFALSDTPGPLWPGHCGLFGLDGEPMPAWHALTELTGGSG